MKRKTEREKFEEWADKHGITLLDRGIAWWAWESAKRQAARERKR